MVITTELSLYPLCDDYVPPIRDFIDDLRGRSGIEVVPNQLSTQVRGEFDAVTGAINACMRRAMEADSRLVLVVKYLNVDRDIGRPPSLD